MTSDEAMEIVEELSVLKFFPSSAGARGKLAAMIDGWCRGDMKQARWLVDQGIKGMDEYPGPATLEKLVCDKFRPAGPLATPQPLKPSYADCQRCGDLGTRWDEGAQSNVWCDCDQAAAIRAEMPEWLATTNRMRGSKQKEADRAKVVAAALKQLEDGYGDEE